MPDAEAKKVLHRLVPFLQTILPRSDFAHGARPGTSCVTAAQPHAGCTWLINYDLVDAFHQILFRHVLALLRQRFDDDAATTLARCVTASIDGARRVPQGYPTSPVVASAALVELDALVVRGLPSSDWKYTRYLDDLAVSTRAAILAQDVQALAQRLRHTIVGMGWQVQDAKGHVSGGQTPRIVAGIVVGPGEKLRAPRARWRLLRAMVTNAERGTPRGHIDEAYGLATYLAQIEPERAAPFLKTLDRLRDPS